jgi:hypothetical protein
MKASQFSLKLTFALLVSVSLSAVMAGTSSYERKAEQILNATGIKGGLIVHIGCGDGKLTAALRANQSFLVHGLDTEIEHVEKAREYIQSVGSYGNVSIDRFNGKQLPYVDNLVNLVLAENFGETSMGEVMRVLCPNGLAYVRENGKWKTTIKPRPNSIDDRTHYLHDASGNAVAADLQVGPPKHIHWLAAPLWSRSHEFNPSLNALVSDSRRMFYIFDDGIAGLPDLRFPAKWNNLFSFLVCHHTKTNQYSCL